VVIYGIEPEKIAFDLQMTDVMLEKIPQVISLVKKELETDSTGDIHA
jgi:hypothetical protein